MRNVVLIKFGEIGLKGKNRYIFESVLMDNIRLATGAVKNQLKLSRGRIYLYCDDKHPTHFYRDRLQHVFGLVGFAFAKEMPNQNSMADLVKLTLTVLKETDCSQVRTFKVDARRAAKDFPLDTMDLNKEIGAVILKEYPQWEVDVHQPDCCVYVEVRQEGLYVFTHFQSESGPGGLPVGVGGRGLLLLSGGIDSPVAGWSMLKRGMQIDAVHFHSFPYTGEKAREKAIDLARALTQWKLRTIHLYMPFFTRVQETVNQLCPEPTWTLIHRRFMLRIAERIAVQKNEQIQGPYHGFITGDNLGQVASQTIQNIAVVSHASKIPVLRPLISFDKQEIIERAAKIDTLRISQRPHADCCTIFASKIPITKAYEDEILVAETRLPINSLIEEALEKMQIIRIPYENAK